MPGFEKASFYVTIKDRRGWLFLFTQSASKDGGAVANGRMDAPLSDCGNLKQPSERKDLSSTAKKGGRCYGKI